MREQEGLIREAVPALTWDELAAQLAQAVTAKASAVSQSEHHLRMRLSTERAADDIFRKNCHLLDVVKQWKEKVDSLFDAIKHGDENHQKWLKAEIEKHFSALR